MADAVNRSVSRRGVIAVLACVPVGLLGLASMASAQDANACFDLDTLPASQKSMRRSLGFKPVSADPKKHCSLCSFFTAAAAGCGKCALLSGGAVSANSICDSWAAKA